MGLLALAAVFGCKSADGYAHMGIDISVDGLTAEQKKLVSAIEISSQPEGNTDPNKIYRVGVNASELDAHGAAHADYIPNPQSGTFVVSVALLDAKSEQLAIKSQKTKVVAGKAADLNFDFVSEISKQGDCRTDGDVTLLTESPLGGNSLSVLWDVDHYKVSLHRTVARQRRPHDGEARRTRSAARARDQHPDLPTRLGPTVDRQDRRRVRRRVARR